MLTARRLLGQIHKEGFTDVTLAEIETALSNIDQSAILQNCQNKYHYVIWDRVSPINGVQASVFLDRDDVRAVSQTQGQIMLLYKDDKLVYFQPTNPKHGGFVAITTETIAQVAQELINPLAQSDASASIISQVYTAIGL